MYTMGKANQITVFLNCPNTALPISLQTKEFAIAIRFRMSVLFTSKSKTMHRTRVAVTLSESKTAASNLLSHVGQLFSFNTNHFITYLSDSYSCSWLRTITHVLQHFELRIFKAYIEGHNLEIPQSITKTSCSYPWHSCIPTEEPRYVIVWNNVSHDSLFSHYLHQSSTPCW